MARLFLEMRLLDHRLSLNSALVKTENQPNQLIIQWVFVKQYQEHSTLFDLEGNTEVKTRYGPSFQKL